MNKLGIMQGRLSPMINDKIQAFPLKNWEKEFYIASKIGFELIEWVLDLTDINENPLLSKDGRKKINKCINESGILVPSVCCDYFVDVPITSKNFQKQIKSFGMLFHLIRICPEVGIKDIEIPLIANSSINTKFKKDIIICLLNDLVPLLNEYDINLLLETDLPPEEIGKLFSNFNSNRIMLNYDTGNSAYWGFNSANEINIYGNKIGNIHIKDCTPEKYSVMLGTGNVDFDETFKLLKKINYSRDFILQPVRDENDIELAKNCYKFTKKYITKYLK